LTEGNYYEGDMLNAILQIDKDHWAEMKEHWNTVDVLIKDKLDYLKTIEPKLHVDNFYKCRPL
jgi:hypothetical protein